MKSHAPTLILLILLACAAARAEEKPVLVVYDFTSTFDKGQMGQWVAEMVRGHAQRTGRYIGNPKITVDEVLADRAFAADVNTDPEKLAKFTRDAFQADILIYGSIAQKGADDYAVCFRVYRALADGAAEKILDETRDCPGKRTVQLAVDDVLNLAAGMKDPATEWRLLSSELKELSQALAKDAADANRPAVDWRQDVLSWQDRITGRWRNVTARTHRDYASKALLDYVDEIRDGQLGLVQQLTAGKPDAARADAARLAKLADGLARSIDAWQDDAAAEKRWETDRNLVMNGGFEFGQQTPANWQPLKEHMSWVADPDGKSGKVVRFDMPEDIAATYGMLLYSQPFTVEPGATYRLRWRFKTMAPAVKLFLKGCAEFGKDFGFEGQEREVWRSRKDPQHGPRVVQDYEKGEWTLYGHDFEPFCAGRTDPQTGRFAKAPAQPVCVRLMLYAYWPKGVVYWDDMVVKKIKDAPIRPTD